MPLWPALTVLFGPLHAVVGPQRLRAVIDLDGLHGILGLTSLARVKDAIFFFILLAILIARPTGLLGREGYR